MDRIEITERITLEGNTFQPGTYTIVKGNDFAPGMMTEAHANKVLHDHASTATLVKPPVAKQQTTSKPKRKATKK